MKASEIDWRRAPEGAMYYLPENDSYFSLWVKKGDDEQWMVWLADGDTCWDEDDSIGEVEHLLLQRTSAWSGTGLPPVGTVCEHEPMDVGGEWVTVQVIAHTKAHGRAVAVFQVGDDVSFSSASCFRPVRTPEQIAADERMAAVIELTQFLVGQRHCTEAYIAERIYDAGYRKVEGDKQ